MARQPERRQAATRGIPALIALLGCAAGPIAARPAMAATGLRAGVPGPQARMHASLAPLHLGRTTAITVGFKIGDPPRQDPSPLTGMRLLLPAEMSIDAS